MSIISDITSEVRIVGGKPTLYIWKNNWLEFQEAISEDQAKAMANNLLTAFSEKGD